MDTKIRILIVEDEALIADEIRRTLEGLGYEVAGRYYDYDTAAAALIQTDADLVMLDINLGEGTDKGGIALAGILKAQNPKPFLFLTAYSDADTVAKAAALHPSNYLVKPLSPQALFVAIQLALAHTQEGPRLPAADLDFFYVKVGTRKQKIFWREVYCMEASKNYVLLFVNGLVGNYPVRGSIAFVWERLMPESLRKNFFKLGRSLALNSQHVTASNESTIVCGGRTFDNGGRLSEAQLETLG
jgi:DNA-binding response OmpR family regulator